MFKFFKSIFRWFFGKPPSFCITQATEEVLPPSVEPLVVKDSTPESDPQQKIYGYYAHSRNRLMERYGLSLTYDIWQGWINQISSNHVNAVFVEKKTTGGSIWRVWFGHRVVFVVYKDDMIVTVLPVKARLQHLANINLKNRNRELAAANIFKEAAIETKTTVVDTKPQPPKMPKQFEKYKNNKLEAHKNKYVRGF